VILNDLQHPIVQAPMAGGPSTPELAVAVCEAGGLGFVAGAYLTAERLREQIAVVRAGTDAPFGVNLFVPSPREIDDAALSSYMERIAKEAADYGAEAGEPAWNDDHWDAKLALLAEERVAAVSFTFGLPTEAAAELVRGAGSELWVTVTTPDDARSALDRGADVLVVQGVEAGGHQSTFVDDLDGPEGLGLLALIRLVAAETDVPLVAAGGISDGAAVAAVLAAGAAAAQVGTGFLLSPEAATTAAHRAALINGGTTELTRAFSGRPARGIVNRFQAQHSDFAPSAYPQVHNATSALRAAAREQGDSDGFNLWAGQAHRLARAEPAADTVRRLSSEAAAALGRATRRLER
jgi:nitronate monooxygenase